MGHHYLKQLMNPHSIAVFGASENSRSVGTLVLKNLLGAAFKGETYPVNPKYSQVQGLRCYPDLHSIQGHIDLAVVTTPAKTVANIMQQCAESGVRHVVVLSAGFSETGRAGKLLEQQLQQIAREYGLHLLGPNCFGVMRPAMGLNATFSRNQAQTGKLALVSQSGAICTAILDWASKRQVGFSSVVSLGDAADVDFGEILDYLALDPKTDSILLYVEGIRDARSFMSGLRAASRMKPVIVLKAGRYEEGSRAAVSHTGTLVGGFAAFDAALQRAGVVRVDSITQLFTAAEVLSSGIRVERNRLLIITNGGGSGVMATDRAIEMGLQMTRLSPATLKALDKVLPFSWSQGNPIDILGDATPERYQAVLEICLREEQAIDGVLVMLTPQAMTDPEAVAATVAKFKATTKKPLLACWMGGEHIQAAHNTLRQAHIPYFSAPELAVEAFSFLASYRNNQQLLMQVPASVEDSSKAPDIKGSRLIIESVLAEGRRVLSITESRAILSAFGVPSTRTILTRSPTEALVAAESLGFPVVMKISSPDIQHKSDVNGVRLNINSAHTVRSVYQELLDNVYQCSPEARIDGVTVETMHRSPAARELMVGVVRDPVFGPVISFGGGGTAVEVHRDQAIALPPLNEYMIRKTIDSTRIAKMLGPFRQMPAVNMEALEHVLQQISGLVCELPEIVEMDINPLIVDDKGVVAVDARLCVSYADNDARPYAHMAIHPYPSDLVREHQLPDGTNVLIRPIRPADAEMEQNFVRNLSGESKYMRFMQALQELTPNMLVRLTQIDYDREMAFIALSKDNGDMTEVGVSRVSMNPDGEGYEFALVVADAWRGRGLGTLLMQAIVEHARNRGMKYIVGDVLAENTTMLKLMGRLGFQKRRHPDDLSLTQVIRYLS